MAGFSQTLTPLAGGATYTTAWKNTERYLLITGLVFSDQSGTLHIEQSFDTTNADEDSNYTISASDGKGFREPVVAPYFRIRYVNDATPQTSFRLSAVLRDSEGT